MKYFIRFIAAALILSAVATLPAFAWATKNDGSEDTSGSGQSSKDLFYDDFIGDQEGGKPRNYELTPSDCIITVEQMDVGNGKKKNCLLLHDTKNTSSTEFIGPKVVRRFDAQKDTFAVEFRFKMEKTRTSVVPVNVEIKSNNDIAFALMLPSDTGILSYSNGTGRPLAGNQQMPFDTWATVRAVFDIEQQKVDVMVQSDFLKERDLTSGGNVEFDREKGRVIVTNLTPRENFTGGAVDNLSINMSRWEGKTYFDYIKVEKGADRMVISSDGPAIKPPVVETPPKVPSGRYANVSYNGIYYFWTYRPVTEQGRTMVPLFHVSEILGLNVQYGKDNGKIVLKKEDITIEMTLDSTKALAGGKEILLEVSPCLIDSIPYVPIRFLAESLGLEVSWEEETKTVAIKEVQAL